MIGSTPKLSVSDFISLTNQNLEYSYQNIFIEGEIGSFKVSQGKFVFFDLKDESSSVGCFMMLFQMRFSLQDGMKVVVNATPKLTAWGKFSLTISAIQPVGEGSVKKSFDLLKQKLQKEGLFDTLKKRPLPSKISKIAVISSKDAAGYADFIKIINERWGGLQLDVAHVQVQGLSSADQVINALKYFNQQSKHDVIAIIRGGGSQQDLASFSDELLVREIAASKIPVITGIGHEVDESLADLVADLAASTPSNVAQILTPDKKSEMATVKDQIAGVGLYIINQISACQNDTSQAVQNLGIQLDASLSTSSEKLSGYIQTLDSLNPENILKRGYSIFQGREVTGSVVKITTYKNIIQAEVKNVKVRTNN